MLEYGYINENGCLTSKMLGPYIERYKEGEEIKERTVSIEEQAENLATLGWKPVDLIDNSQIEAEVGYCINIVAYDAGDRISYRYDKLLDRTAIQKDIKELKKRLSSTESEIGDYKITKCYEATMLGKNLPYDVEKLYAERQAVRAEINRLEEILNNQVSNI